MQRQRGRPGPTGALPFETGKGKETIRQIRQIRKIRIPALVLRFFDVRSDRAEPGRGGGVAIFPPWDQPSCSKDRSATPSSAPSYDVYNALDFGFLEHIYKAALEKVLRARGHRVDREVPVVVHYNGEPIAVQIIDMIVDERVVVEAKATANVHPAWGRQLHNYLRATDLEVGLLLHFGLEAKFYRIVELRSRKVRKTRCDTNVTDLTNPTNRSSPIGTPLRTSKENVEES